MGRWKYARKKRKNKNKPEKEREEAKEHVHIGLVTPRPERVYDTCNCRGTYVHQVSL